MKNQKNKKGKIVLLDSHAILHRAYHALPDFASSKGEPTGAIYGLSLMILSIIKEFRPDYIIAAFDLPKPTYRHEAYTDYKAGRKEADSELVSQIKKSYEFYKAFNIPVYQKEGYEADDILGTLSVKLKDDFDVIIASGDMDTLQLVYQDDVKVFTLKKGIKDTILYDEKAVFDRFGFLPKFLPDYKGLRGDPSDNIIGISGIGEKTATVLISEFGSIENIYKNLDKNIEKFNTLKISPRIQTLLKENQEEAEFSKMLATIQKDVPIDFNLPDEKWIKSVSVSEIQKFFQQLEFRTLIDRVKDVLALFDLKEGDNKNYDDFLNQNQTEKDSEKKENNKNIDTDKLNEAKIGLWLLNSAMTNPDLSDILNYTNEQDFDKAFNKILNEIEKQGLQKVFNEIEKPLIKIVDEMEKNGIKIDPLFFQNLSNEYHAELSILEKEIYQMSGAEFNINSTQQLADVLFNKMQLKYKGMRKTSTGKFSTKEDVLQKLKSEHQIVDKILQYRELQKLLSTYIDNIPKMIAGDGRLHANFIQTGTTTGRMSSNNPNLQNIPVGSDKGRKIRKGFVAEKGSKLVSLDYSQFELRIAAFLSGDEKMIDSFKNGEDIHTAVASEVFRVSKDKVDKEMRRQAKVINFGILYGMGISALKENLGSDRQTAQQFYNDYFSVYSGLANFLDKTKKDASKLGYTKTFFGRKRYFDGLNSKIPFIRAQAERMAINAPIQGTQADLIKMAMVDIDKYLKNEELCENVKLILQIHDEVVYEIKDEFAEQIANKIKEIMENVLDEKETAGVPIIAEYNIADNWGDLK